ncbi:MAG: hypothetical protein AAGJ82_01550 [Bacteroidota bacterium]
MNRLLPAFWRRFDHYLLTHHPAIWQTRIHQVLLTCWVMGVTLFTIGYCTEVNINGFLHRTGYITRDVEYALPFTFITIGLGLIFWRYKLRAFPLQARNFAGSLALLMWLFLGFVGIYYAGAAYGLGRSWGATKHVEQALGDDLAWLRANNYLRMPHQLAFSCDQVLLGEGDCSVEAREELAAMLLGKKSEEYATNFDSYGGEQSPRLRILRDRSPNYSQFGIYTPYARQLENHVTADWSSEQLVDNLIISLQAKEAFQIKRRKERQYNSDYYDPTKVRHWFSEHTMIQQVISQLDREGLSALIQRAGPLVDWLPAQSSASLHQQLTWYELYDRSLSSLSVDEQQSYQQYRRNILTDWRTNHEAKGSLFLTELRTFTQTFPSNPIKNSLDERSLENYEKVCFYYLDHMPKHPEFPGGESGVDLEALRTELSQYEHQAPQLYTYDWDEMELTVAEQQATAPFTIYLLWLQQQYDLYQRRFSLTQRERLERIAEQLGIRTDFQLSFEHTHNGNQEWMPDVNHQNFVRKYHLVESAFLTASLTGMIDKRLHLEKNRRSDILTMTIGSDTKWFFPLLLLAITCTFFFLYVFPVRSLLFGGIAAGLLSFGVVFCFIYTTDGTMAAYWVLFTVQMMVLLLVTILTIFTRYRYRFYHIVVFVLMTTGAVLLPILYLDTPFDLRPAWWTSDYYPLQMLSVLLPLYFAYHHQRYLPNKR